MSTEYNIKCLVNYINEAETDNIKMRNISNFYERCLNGRYKSNDFLVDELIKYRKYIIDKRDLSMFDILPFVFSDRDPILLPNKIEEKVDYTIGNMPLDKDLESCNILVYEREFKI